MSESAADTLQAVAYLSTAIGSLSDEELEALLVSARTFNEAHGITGCLLYHDGAFFQYFEGPPASVDQVYARIRSAPLHTDIVELFNRGISERVFSRWYMGFARAPEPVMLSLAQADWAEVAWRAKGLRKRPLAMDLLLGFWQSAQGTA